MKQQRGLLRAWASIALLWAAYWGWTYHTANQAASAWQPEIQFWHDEHLKSQSSENKQFDDHKMGEAAEFRNQQIDVRDGAREYGLLGLLVIAAGTVLSLWVLRGFKEK